MTIIDQYNESELPKDVQDWAAGTTTIDFGDVSGAKEAATMLEKDTSFLNRWDINTHFFKDDAEVKVGFFKKLFSGTTKVVKAGVIQEAKFYRIDQTDGGHEVQVGVAVRLAVATSNFSVTAELSIPNLTASAQLGLSDTRVGIYVVGSRIPIGDILPAPTDINVENYSLYIESFKEIQNRVFSPENEKYFTPSIISYDRI